MEQALEHAYAVILAGGKGERFWPASTSAHPKQLLSLLGERTMLGMAIDRLEGLIPPERVLVITNRDLVEATAASAPELPAENIVGEPVGRDTAPAVALAAALVKQRDPAGVFCILTADHVMGDVALYRRTLREALERAAREDVLITIGILPTEPNTGYGYIRSGAALEGKGGIPFRRAEEFVEKPDRQTAQAYLDAGGYYWNAGMFIWSADAVRRAFERHAPDMAALMDAVAPCIGAPDFAAGLAAAYRDAPRISIDFALMEKADNILMAEGGFPWDDIGSWPALANHFPADGDDNVAVGELAQLDASGNVVYSRGRLTALIGVEDLVVVQAEGVTLVCPKDRAQDIKMLVTALRERGDHDELL